MADNVVRDSLPRGVVSITVTRLLGLGSAPKPTRGKALYAAITVDGRFLGRSVPFSGATELDLAGLFEHTVIPTDDRVIPVLVELFPVEGTGAERTTPLSRLSLELASPWTSDRLTSSGSPGFEVSVVTRLVPEATRKAVAARTIEGTKTQSTLALRDALLAMFVDVEGLYKPTAMFKQGVRAAEREEGYASDNGLGRVYVCHNREGRRSQQGQSVVAVVRVLSMGPFAVSSPVRVRWRLIDVDDPSDDRPSVLTPFRGYLDANDYTPRGQAPFAAPRGPQGDDNEGAPTRSPPWEEVSGFSLSESDAKTALTEATKLGPFLHESKVVLHCPSLAGDNFLLEAEPVVNQVAAFVARTGVITMWQRLDVQCYVARDAAGANLGLVRRLFEPACVQLDFAEDAPIDHEGVLEFDKFGHKLRSFFGGFDRHFQEPGWFSVTFVKDLRGDDAFTTTDTVVFAGNAKLQKGAVPALDADPAQLALEPLSQYVEVKLGAIPGGGKPNLKIDMQWLDRSVTLRSLGTEALANGSTRIWLAGAGLTPEFVAGNGSIEDAMASTRWCLPTLHHRAGVVLGTGFGWTEGQEAPMKITHQAKTTTPSKSGPAGMCGTRPVQGLRHFANYVFVGSEKVTDPDQLAIHEEPEPTVIHELGHALGFPHRCGYSGFFGNRCVMNYGVDWYFTDESLSKLAPFPVPGSDYATFCARHAKEIRRAILEKNPAYRWKYDSVVA